MKNVEVEIRIIAMQTALTLETATSGSRMPNIDDLIANAKKIEDFYNNSKTTPPQ